MLNLTEEQKQMFYSDKYSYNYIFRFPEIGLEFDNEQLHSEDVTLKESICDEEDLVLGGCIASSISFTVSEIIADEISGLTFTTEMAVKDESGEVVQTVPMGMYIVDNPEQANNKDRKSVTAYDRMYEISVDVSDWYSTFFADGAKHTVKETRESLLTHLGIPFVVQTLPNDDVSVEKTVEPNGSLHGTTVLKNICEINGAFGRMNRHGKFEEIHLSGLSVFPEDSKDAENIYPDETLYPEDGFEYFGLTYEDEFPEYRDVTYSEYMTQPITSITIQSDQEDVGVTVGEDISNPYVITSNIFLYGKSSEEITSIGENILKKIKGFQYRPNTTELCGLPYIECGDSFVVEIEGNIVESVVFSRTLKGIQLLIDTFESKGNKIRANEVSQSDEIQQLKGKTLKITKQLDNFAVALKNIEEDTESVLNMTSSNILLQVSKDGKVAAITLDGEEGSDSVKIDLSAAHISIESDNWNVDENGAMTVKAITIEGGTVEIETSADSDDKIDFTYLTDNGGRNGVYRHVKMFSNGFTVQEINGTSPQGDIIREVITDEKGMHSSYRRQTKAYEPEVIAESCGNFEFKTKSVDDSGYFESDIPIRMPNIVSGSVIGKIEKTNEVVSIDVLLDMSYTPSVVVTPETLNPSGVNVSVSDVSDSGFTINMARTDTTGNLKVFWTAMC